MPTDQKNPDISIFFFAHQDDEAGVFAQIENDISIGRRVVCIYATDGGATADPFVRNAESEAVLIRLGVEPKNVLFLGLDLGIRDGRLNETISLLANWSADYLKRTARIEAIYVPALEGGHSDHDLLHAVVVKVSSTQDMTSKIRQYALYNALSCMGPFFKVLTPLKENGPITAYGLTFRQRLRYLRLMLFYRSQWKTWLGLFPFFALNYALEGSQKLQTVDPARIGARPHAGELYFEKRRFLTWPLFIEALEELDAALAKSVT